MPHSSQEQPAPSLVHPVILCGGAGTRLWPASRALEPKPFLALAGERSLLQETALRVAEPGLFAAPIVVCHADHRFLVAEQLREADIAPAAILLEPEGRNTAPAAAAAARLLLEGAPDGLEPVMLVLPSDHVIGEAEAFRALVGAAVPAARAGALVTFGIAPDRPETGYGWIRAGETLEGAAPAKRIARFLEKPDAQTAARLIAEGGWLWNAGIFLLPARAFLAELETHAPGIAPAAEKAVAKARRDGDFLRLDATAFRAAPSRSIDHAVMEKTGQAAVLPAAALGSGPRAWSDAGSWAALWETGTRDDAGNVVLGDALAAEARGCYLRAESRLVAALGTQDLVVVETRDAVLVAPRARAQEVKGLVERLAEQGRSEAATPRRVRRPWGSYETLEAGPGFQVKRLTVLPGARLSLQAHKHRAEHWVVVRGTARVTRDAEVFELEANQSTFIPLGARHRLENPGRELLEVIEVQSGDYLGEDDIVRFDDVYGRVAETATMTPEPTPGEG